MSLQIRRGTAAQLSSITPVVGELIFTTDTKAVYVGDGSTQGGVPVAVGGSGNVTGTNVLTTGVVSATGNITGGNIRTVGQVSATGNISANYFFGNGSQLTGLIASSVDANALTGNTLASTVLYSSLTRVGTLANVTVTANVTGGNLVTGGVVSATANVIGGNITTAGQVFATATVTGGNLATSGTASATGNVTGGNILTAGLVSASGNVSGNYLRATLDINAGGNITATNYTGTTVSMVGNVTGGNILTGGVVSATGNISGNYFVGNGSQLTGVSNYGNSNVNTLLATWGTNTVSTTGTITGGNITGDNLITGGIVSATSNISGGNIVTGGIVSATGNVAGNYFVGNGSALTGVVATGIGTLSSLSVTGNITAGNITVSTGTVSVGTLVNNNANGVGNIGSSSNYFNTVFAKATSAQYADLAENYTADAEYAPGTVVIFGGDEEITISTEVADERVAGAISTNPAHLMNSTQPGLAVALRGRVPVKLIGPVTKGDGLVTSSVAGHAQSVGRSRLYGQAVFAKALETNLADGEKTIIAVIL